MYCGDETGAYVGDVGSHTARFGYGGEDCPKVVLPSAVYRHYGGTVDYNNDDEGSRVKKRKAAKYSAPVSLLNAPPDDCFTENEVGFIPIYNSMNSNAKSSPDVDTEALAALWECSYQSLAVRDRKKHTVGPRHDPNDTIEGPIDHPLLASIDPHRGEKHHASILEMFFESLSAPAAYLAPSATLSAFSFGRPTALVVDVGHSSARVTPVMDGYTLKFGSVQSQRGGDWLARVQEKVLACNDLWGDAPCPCPDGVMPRYMLRNKDDNLLKLKILKESSFHDMSVHQVMYEMMTGSHVLPLEEEESSLPAPFSDNDSDDSNAVEDEEVDEDEPMYVLPDGTRLDLGLTKTGKDLRRLPELFFSESLPTFLQTDTNTNSDENITTQPLHQLVQHSLSQILDADIRKELISNIILTGSSSLFTGMDKRLSSELSRILPSMYKNKVISSKNSVENRYSAWIGGSILSSLGSFQQMWLSRREYDECGSFLGLQKFHS
ncbi:hypothetical protein HJC23_013128 [Cyclotella cryptica]|uniref:Actin n=1 Tax=Cyclotella cryptica TaxID=29204 RepID=A0ABD3QMX1_9STRA|eukprot:CCRYP_003937-RA/>CCRYP_003937-RA protein AED:0.14 eAED:0.14 QI:149/1/1/1/1/1/2/1395/491